MNYRRKLIIALGAAPWPLARAQQPKLVYRVGYLTERAPEIEKRWLAAFVEGMAELGYIEGKNVVIEQRHANLRVDKLPELVAELVRMKVDVLVATGGTAVAAKKVTATLPIVSLSQDPVAFGLAKSLARPGGNVTGVSDHHSAMGAKRLEMLKEIKPSASRIAVFFNSNLPPNVNQLKDLQVAAKTLRLVLDPIDVKRLEDIVSAFARFGNERIDALLLLPGPSVSSHMPQIAKAALDQRIPAIYTVALWAELGGLISYGTDFYAYYKRAATYVDKILKGAKPSELPIEEPTRFELVVNATTAKALGLEIPQTILVRADRVIK